MRVALAAIAIGILGLGGYAFAASSPSENVTFSIPVDRTVTNSNGATLHLSGTLSADIVIPGGPPPPPPPPPTGCDATLNAGGNITDFEQSLRAGEVGCLHGGTYGPAQLNKSGTEAAPITITSFPGETATIDAGGQDAGLTFNARHLVISHLKAMNADGEGAALFYGRGASTDVLISQNELGPTESQGIFLEATTHEYTIDRNYIHDIGADPSRQTHGIYMEGTDHRISNNLIVNEPHGFGIQIYPYDRRIEVVNNTISNTEHAGIILGGQTVGAEGKGVQDVDIVNNIVTHTDDVAVLCYQRPENYRIHHNLAFDTAHGTGSHCQLGSTT